MRGQREPLDANDFAYNPFSAQVMANPLPYYRILRDHHPVYYMPQWDTYALSRFEDIWQVLEVNDGTFVASEGTLPAASVLAKHNTGPVDDPPLHPLPFHAVFDTDLYARDPARALPAAAPQGGHRLGGQNPRAGQRAPR